MSVNSLTNEEEPDKKSSSSSFVPGGIPFGMPEVGKFMVGLANYLINPGTQKILVIDRKHALFAGAA